MTLSKKGPVSIGNKKPETSYPGLRNQVAYSSFAYASGGPRGASLSGGSRFKSAPGRPVLLSARLPSASSGPRGGPRHGQRPQRPRRPSPSKFGGSRTTTPAYTSTTTTPAPTTTLGFCKMVMFDKTYLRGQPVEITG